MPKKMIHFAAESHQMMKRYEHADSYECLSVTDQQRMLAMLQDICQGLQRFIHLTLRKNLLNDRGQISASIPNNLTD